MTTGYVWHEKYGWHDTGNAAGFIPASDTIQPYQHVESADSKTRLASLVEASGLLEHLTRLAVPAASEEDLRRVHTQAHVDRIKTGSAAVRGGDSGDGYSPFGPGGYEIGLLAAGGTMAALSSTLTGEVRNAYALVRPPGHHALPDQGLGFCMFANIPIAIESARHHLGLERVAVVDWDVHHGNGTQDIYYSDPNTLAISLHQDGLFPPQSGLLEERGSQSAIGATINIPLPAGSGNGAYLEAMRKVVAPALRAFRPELIVVASGFDSSFNDPIGRMLMTARGYRQLTRQLLDLADELCQGRLVMSHEGGYSPVYVPFCGLAVIEEMSGIASGLEDPYDFAWSDLDDQELKPHQAEIINSLAGVAEQMPAPQSLSTDRSGGVTV